MCCYRIHLSAQRLKDRRFLLISFNDISFLTLPLLLLSFPFIFVCLFSPYVITSILYPLLLCLLSCFFKYMVFMIEGHNLLDLACRHLITLSLVALVFNLVMPGSLINLFIPPDGLFCDH